MSLFIAGELHQMASKGLFPLKRFYDSNVSFATLSSDTLEVPVLHTAVLSSQRTAAQPAPTASKSKPEKENPSLLVSI